MSFLFEGLQIQAEDGETVLSALLRNEIEVKSGCRAGACQSCVLRSDQSVPSASQAGLDDHLVERGIFLSCQAKANAIESAERVANEVFPRHPAVLSEKQLVSDDVLVTKFEVPGWHASPGRFIRLTHPSGVTRPYSLAAPGWESSSSVHLHVRLIERGQMSRLLLAAEIGEKFEIEGPFGKCSYRTVDGREPIVLIGSGTGLAPLYGIATDALQRGHVGSIHLYHGAASSSRLYFRAELSKLAQSYSTLAYVPCADSADVLGDREGSPLSVALSDHPDLKGYRVYLCGHPELVKLGKRKCFLAGANLRDISADPFEAA